MTAIAGEQITRLRIVEVSLIIANIASQDDHIDLEYELQAHHRSRQAPRSRSRAREHGHRAIYDERDRADGRLIEKSVDFADADWRTRFVSVKSHAVLRVLPLERGATTTDTDPYEQNNLRMLEAAERFGADKVEFICLWDGQQGDGQGGTRHLMEEVRNRGGRVHWLDTTKLWS